MKRKTPPQMPLAERFTGTAPEFQAKMQAIANVAEQDALAVYGLWREYSDTCHSYDQSPVLFEFIEWNAPRLGGNRDDLQLAIQD